MATPAGSKRGRSSGSARAGSKSPRSGSRKTPPPGSKKPSSSKTKPIIPPIDLSSTARLSPTMFLSRSEKASTRGETEGELLRRMDTFIDIERLGGRHLQPIRPVTARTERDSIATLKLRELNHEVLDALETVALSLKRLDFSRTGIAFVPDALVVHLANLRKLVLNFNRLTENSFPDSFSSLSMLRELSVTYNELRSIPKGWLKLRHLVRLNLEGNKLADLKGIENFKRLAVLVVDRNELTELPKELCSLRRLEGIFAKNNQIKVLYAHLKFLRNLHVLNVSENKLESISAEIFSLPKLEYLCLNHNMLTRLPIFNTQAFQGRRIALVDLGDNRLIRLPEHVLRISEKLDLSNNKIKAISGNTLKRYDKKTEQILDLRGNGTLIPPREVCEAGLKAIIRYFCDEDVQQQIYQGAKVYVMGSRGAGKTSLIRTLIDKQPLLADPDEVTNGMNVLETVMDIECTVEQALAEAEQASESAPDSSNGHLTDLDKTDGDEEPTSVRKSVAVTFWEFGGNAEFIPLFSNFLREIALVLIVFNASEYNSENFGSAIGVWLDFALVRYFKAHILLVASHTDKLPEGKLKRVREQAHLDLRAHIFSRKQLIERDVRIIESNNTISTTLSEYYTHLLHLKDSEVTLVGDEILSTSAETYEGYPELDARLQTIFRTCEAIYPSAMKAHPVKFTDIESHTEDLSESMPLIDWDKYTKLIAQKYSLSPPKTAEVATYMNLCGKIMWAFEDKFYSKKVILKPQVLSEALLALFNFKQILVQNSLTDEPGLSPLTPISPYETAFGELTVDEFVQHGLVNLPFLKYLWTRLVPIMKEEQVLYVAQLIFETQELGFNAEFLSLDELKVHPDGANLSQSSTRPTTAKSEKSSSTKMSEIVATAADLDEFGFRVFLPAVAAPPNGTLQAELDKLDQEELQICAVYQVFGFVAPLLFERLCGRLHKANMIVYRHWPDGVLTRNPEHDHTVIRIEKVFLTDAQVYCIKLIAVSVNKSSVLPPLARRTTPTKDERSQKSSRVSSGSSSHQSRPVSARISSAEQKLLDASSPLPVTDDADLAIIQDFTDSNEQITDRAIAEKMWNVLLPVLKELDDLFQDYPGLWFRRMLRCPLCHEVCFNAEWACRDFHDQNEMTCKLCSKTVPLYLLVQPRERRKIEDIAKLRQMMREKRQKEMELNQAALDAKNARQRAASSRSAKRF